MSYRNTITLRELHLATGRWVKRAATGEIYVTDRGRLPAKPFFANPKFTRAFLAQRKHLRGGMDSTLTISGGRDRELL